MVNHTIYMRKWYKLNKKRAYQGVRKYLLKHPWAKTYKCISTRCNYKKHHYYKKGIKNFLNISDLKSLWFRDKAWLLKKPSIDRIDNNGDYELSNCRYIELSGNLARRKQEKEIKQLSMEGKLIKVWRSINLAGRTLRISPGNISNVISHRKRSAGGFKWELLNSPNKK